MNSAEKLKNGSVSLVLLFAFLLYFVCFFFLLRPGNDDVANATQQVPCERKRGQTQMLEQNQTPKEGSRKRATIGQHTGCDAMHWKKYPELNI